MAATLDDVGVELVLLWKLAQGTQSKLAQVPHRIQHTQLHCDVCRLTNTLSVTTNQSSFRDHQALHAHAWDGKYAKLDFGRVLWASV